MLRLPEHTATTKQVKKRDSWFSEYISEKKDRVFANIGFLAIGVGLAVIISQFGMAAGILAILLSVALPILIYSCEKPNVGVYLTFIIAFFLQGMSRFITLPIGLLVDFLLLFLLLVMVVKVGRHGSWDFVQNAGALMVLLWILFNVFEVANPIATSRLAWVYTIRGMAGAMVFFYICSYAFKTYNHVSIFIELWIFLALILASYGLYQEFHGLSPSEEAWVRADDERFGLFYNWGRFRKFSFFTDPTSFGMAVAYTSVLCLVLSLGNGSFIKRIYYLGASGVMALGMVFSGTRTAYVLIPIGIMFFTVLTLKRSFIIFSIVFFLAGAGVILSPIKSIGPLDANALERLRSAFVPESDPSFQVRLKNQAFIKPYIQSHPIGAGLGSVGDWGHKFSPGSALANFPPDSGFVKIAIELGWVGLLLYSIMLFVVMEIGIKNYHIIQDPRLKNTQAALLSVQFCLIIANYAQEAITMYPTSIIFYASMAMVTIMPKFETAKT